MPSRKEKRKAKQRRQQAAIRLERQERPKRYWLKRKARNALSRIRLACRVVWRYLLRPTQRAVVGIIILLAAGSEIYYSTWRMSVTPGETLKASDPFTTIFVLHNEGQFSMYDIEFGCLVHDVLYPNQKGIPVSQVSAHMPSKSFNVPQLEANGRTSTPCWMPALLTAPESVDISILVSYRPGFSPFRRRNAFRFIARPNDKGGYSLTPMSTYPEYKFWISD